MNFIVSIKWWELERNELNGMNDRQWNSTSADTVCVEVLNQGDAAAGLSSFLDNQAPFSNLTNNKLYCVKLTVKILI